MTKKNEKYAREKRVQERNLLLALKAYRTGQCGSLRKVASAFCVKYETLRDRNKGVKFYEDACQKNCKLSKQEQEQLCQWVERMAFHGLPPRKADLREMANNLLARGNEGPNLTVGKNWVDNFLRRHPELCLRVSRTKDYGRAKCEDPKVISEWYERIRDVKLRYGILEEDIYNVDETGFEMGLISAPKMITGTERRNDNKATALQSGNREWVTVIECVSSTGFAIPPTIIFKHQGHMEYQIDALPDGWDLALSDSGWTNNDIALSWLKLNFIPNTNKLRRGRYILLILDGHGSHKTVDFHELCWAHDIIPLFMPTQSSHKIQPLDVGCFSNLKHYYSKELQDRLDRRPFHVDKEVFIKVYEKARTDALTTHVVKEAFEATGIVPYNPDRVLSGLDIVVRTPTPRTSPIRPQNDSSPETPRNLRDLEKLKVQLLRDLSQNKISPTKKKLEQVFKGSEIIFNENTRLIAEMADLKAAMTEIQRKNQA